MSQNQKPLTFPWGAFYVTVVIAYSAVSTGSAVSIAVSEVAPYEEGYQTDEIAEMLGENGSNIRTRLKRARAKLKEILKGEYDFGEQV